jgi:two-component system LytT family response regulator
MKIKKTLVDDFISIEDELTAIIVGDKPKNNESLKSLISIYCPEVKLIGTFNIVPEAMKLITTNLSDIVFLNLETPIIDDFELIADYNDPNLSLVYVSSYTEYAIKAIKSSAFDFILKPIELKELKHCIKRIIEKKSKKMNYSDYGYKLLIPSLNGFFVLPFEDIVRLEADGCYTIIVMKDSKRKTVSRTLKEFELSLPERTFLRVHKSYMVNVNFIKEFSKLGGNYITMIDGAKIEVSRRKLPEFLEKIGKVFKKI